MCELQFGNKVRTACEDRFCYCFVSGRRRQQNITLYADVILTMIAVRPSIGYNIIWCTRTGNNRIVILNNNIVLYYYNMRMPHTIAGNASICIFHTVRPYLTILVYHYCYIVFLCLNTTRNFIRPMIIGLKQNIIMYFYRFIDVY